MWRKLPHSNPIFVSFTKDNGYCIYITDYINIWWVNYQEKEFLSLLKKSNGDLEMEDDNELLQLGVKMLLQPENLKMLDLIFEDKSLNVSMTMSCGFPVYLYMKLAEGSREMFFKNVTQQLLKTVHDLKTSESELRFLLIKKDKEIEEYKSETDLRLAMYLKTGVFRDEEHMGKHPIYDTYFGTSEVCKCLLEKLIDQTENQVIVKQENLHEDHRPKIEPDTQQPIKNDPETIPDNTIQNALNSNTVKREIKKEHHNISPSKKLRKILKI